jgi:hypothetical protein
MTTIGQRKDDASILKETGEAGRYGLQRGTGGGRHRLPAARFALLDDSKKNHPKKKPDSFFEWEDEFCLEQLSGTRGRGLLWVSRSSER